ncbi:MAG: hypothetical protein OXJ52_02955 [Oligoflexia bacterium]|nr:hypothetical protein [Oligoflexia bacterium]
MIKILEFLLQSSPVVALVFVVYILLDLKIKHLKEDGQNDLKAEIKEIRTVLFAGAGTTIKKVSKNGN